MAGDEELRGPVRAVLRGGALLSGVLILGGLALGRPGLARAGILVMTATPVLRVAVLLAGYVRSGERGMAAAAAAVLALIGLSAAFGVAH